MSHTKRYSIALLLTACLTGLAFSAAAQLNLLADRYEYGKELLRNNMHEQAAEVFAKLSESVSDNPFYEHAAYLQGLALFRAGKTDQAVGRLLQLAAARPQWDKVDEVSYLLGAIYFDQQNPGAAISALAKIRQPELKEQAEQLKKGYFSQFTHDQLAFLHSQYPDDTVLASLLFSRLLKMRPSEVDRSLLESLSKKFGVPAPEYNEAGVLRRSVFKDRYNIAVLLPFQTATTLPGSHSRRNQYVYDLYEGMKIAAAQIKAAGGPELQLFAYDTDRDSLRVQAMINEPTLREADLLVGPISTLAFGPFNQFSLDFARPMVNPISTNSLVVESNPYSFMLLSAPAAQAKAAARYAYDSLKSRTAFILHSEQPKDRQMAEAYQKAFSEMGGKVMFISPYDARLRRFETLRTEVAKIPAESDVHLFVSSAEETPAINLISAMQSLKVNAPIIATEEWLEFPQLSYLTLESARVHLLYPQYIQYQKPEVRAFIKAYVQATNLIPSPFSFLGYETLYRFGTLLKNHGSGFAAEISALPTTPGTLFTAWSYQRGNDNQYVPIVRFIGGRLELVNAPANTR